MAEYLKEEEYYFWLFLKRIRRGEHKVAMSYFFPQNFPSRYRFSKVFIKACEKMFSAWILEEILAKGGWQRQVYCPHNQVRYCRFFQFQGLDFHLSRGVFEFFRFLLEIWYQDPGKPFQFRLPKTTPMDRIVLWLFTTNLISKEQHNLIETFSPVLSQIPLNHFSCHSFLQKKVDFNNFSPEEILFFQAGFELWTSDFHCWVKSLRYKSPEKSLEELRAFHKNFIYLCEQIPKGAWGFIHPLLRLFELMHEEDIAQPDRFVQMPDSDLPKRHMVSAQIVLLDVGTIFESFLIRLQGIRSWLLQFSFVHEEFEMATQSLLYYTRIFDPVAEDWKKRILVYYPCLSSTST